MSECLDANIITCNCSCHTIGIAFYLASNPPQPCCKCTLDKLNPTPINESTLELKRQISDIYNEMGKLSMRINENYSKMREFEKRIVQPMRDQIHVLEKRLEKLESSGNYNKDYGLELNKYCIWLHERIENLNGLHFSSVNAFNQIFSAHLERIEKLEKWRNNMAKNAKECFGESETHQDARMATKQILDEFIAYLRNEYKGIK